VLGCWRGVLLRAVFASQCTFLRLSGFTSVGAILGLGLADVLIGCGSALCDTGANVILTAPMLSDTGDFILTSGGNWVSRYQMPKPWSTN